MSEKHGRLFRIQYEIPPMRAIFDSFIEHIEDRYSESDYIAAFKLTQPRSNIRKTEWITKADADSLYGPRDDEHEQP